MKKPRQPADDKALVENLIGLGESSARKSYYPELLAKIEELKQLNRELEQRVATRTAELESTLDDLKSFQKQLVESEKMASLGSLVAGVAHEINTPLGTTLTAISIGQEQLSDLQRSYQDNKITRSQLAGILEVSQEALVRASDNLGKTAALVAQFKAVAVDQSRSNLRRFNLTHYLREVLSTLEPRLVGRNCRVALEGNEDIEVEADPNSFTQILGHLLVNSLEHGFQSRDRGEIRIRVDRRDDQIELVYRDNGAGVAPEILDKVFDPFFTTQRGKGNTGLGLHVIYNLVTQQFGGSIRCDSKPGRTCFTLRFPTTAPVIGQAPANKN